MNRDKVLATPAFAVVSGPVTNTPMTLTIAAPTNPGSDSTIFLAGFNLSASAAPAAAVRATIGGLAQFGTTALATIGVQVPASAFALLSRDWGTHPVACKAGVDAVMIVPALGTLVVAEAQLYYFIGSP